MPLRPRHPYTAVFPGGLLTGGTHRPKSSPPRRVSAHRCPAHIRQIRAGDSDLEAFDRWFLTYTFPSH
jgi:hypothetical protein